MVFRIAASVPLAVFALAATLSAFVNLVGVPMLEQNVMNAQTGWFSLLAAFAAAYGAIFSITNKRELDP